MSRLWRPLLVGLGLTACAPNLAAPVSVMAIDVTAQGYAPTQVSLTTIREITALKGTAADFVGGARIVVDLNDPLLQGGVATDEQMRQVFLKRKGADVRVNYQNASGVLWPVDFHSWNMVTAYYNFERAFDYFNGMDLFDPEELSESTVYYDPDLTIADASPLPLVDNAQFFSAMQGFMLLPFQDLQAIPIPMNRGIIAHEFSHRIFNERVYQGQSWPEALLRWSDPASNTLFPAFKVIKSLDEGLADYHAVESICVDVTDPQCADSTRFVEATFGVKEADKRDISVETRCLNQSLIDALNAQTSGDTFIDDGLEYQVGTIIASSFYVPAKRLGVRTQVEKAIIRSYDDDNEATLGLSQRVEQNKGSPEKFTLGYALSALVSHLPNTNVKEQICDELLDRLHLDRATDLPDCPGSALPIGLCPPLQ